MSLFSLISHYSMPRIFTGCNHFHALKFPCGSSNRLQPFFPHQTATFFLFMQQFFLSVRLSEYLFRALKAYPLENLHKYISIQFRCVRLLGVEFMRPKHRCRSNGKWQFNRKIWPEMECLGCRYGTAIADYLLNSLYSSR